MSQPIVALNLYDVEGAEITMTVVTAPISENVPTYQCGYLCLADGNAEPQMYSGGTVPVSGYNLPFYQWGFISKAYYIARATAVEPTTSITAPPLLMRADNGNVVILDDDLDAIPSTFSDAPFIFTNVMPNGNGCVTLSLSVSEPPANQSEEVYATIFYYVSTLPGKIVVQNFPLAHIDTTDFRIGFKTFIDPSPTNNREIFTTEMLPIIWVTFSNTPVTTV